MFIRTFEQVRLGRFSWWTTSNDVSFLISPKIARMVQSAVALGVGVGVAYTLFTLVGIPDPDNLFSVHVWGMGIFASLTAFATSLIASPKRERFWLTVHSVLMALAVCSMAVAFAAIWQSKESKGRPHITTWHSYFGLAAVGTAASTSLGMPCHRV
jgi:hypothetical protein